MSPESMKLQLERIVRTMRPEHRDAYTMLAIHREPDVLDYWAKAVNPYTGQGYTPAQLVRVLLLGQPEARL